MSAGQRGAVTPLAIGGIFLLTFVALVVSVFGGALVVVRKTQAAADLAALAGAVALQHGRDGCAAADRSAHVNDVTLMECDVDGEAVRVLVSRLAPRMFGRDLVVRGQARAGPR